MSRILACIDASSYMTSVCDLAAWASKQMRAEIELLHVVQRKNAAAARRDLSGAIGLGVKSGLLEELTRIDEAEGRLAIEAGRALLAGAEVRLREAGVDRVEPLHRHGGIVETIVEREANADLVIIGKRGASSEFASDHIGSKIERVIRASSKPVFVAPRIVETPSAAVIAFDGSPSSSRALDVAASSDLLAGLDLHIVMAGQQDARHQAAFEAAAARIGESGRHVVSHKSDGRAEQVISDYIVQHPGSLLVMGAYGHSPLRTLIIGSTTTAMIRMVHAPVLLVR